MNNKITFAALRHASKEYLKANQTAQSADSQDSHVCFRCGDLQYAFEEGANYALYHQWNRVEDAKPKEGERVLAVVLNLAGSDSYIVTEYRGGKFCNPNQYGYTYEPYLWMSIPIHIPYHLFNEED